MTTAHADAKSFWDASFQEQIRQGAYNTAPVEALVRTVAYYLRGRAGSRPRAQLHFLEMGCGAGANLVWLARQGLRVSGIDVSPTALALAREQLAQAGCAQRVGELREAPAGQVPFADASFDGIVEACVFQHLPRPERLAAFGEIKRLLKPGGVFVGYLLDVGHTVFEQQQAQQLPDDPGTLDLREGRSPLYLTNLGLCHFFRREELRELLDGFAVVDPGLATYELPREEARRRGYDAYRQSMWTVYAIR